MFRVEYKRKRDGEWYSNNKKYKTLAAASSVAHVDHREKSWRVIDLETGQIVLHRKGDASAYARFGTTP